jgi:hypothetical protein
VPASYRIHPDRLSGSASPRGWQLLVRHRGAGFAPAEYPGMIPVAGNYGGGWPYQMEIFYDVDKVAIVPMGFCYPGHGQNGDLPPRPECAPLWHARLWNLLPNIKLFLLIGSYAQNYYLQQNKKTKLTDTVRNYRRYLPTYFPIPHPSPRNRRWQKLNPWFETDVVPELRRQVEIHLNDQKK